MSDTSQDTWVFICPEGKEYDVGDTVPMHRAAEGLIFGEQVVRVPCPGFAGAIIEDEATGKQIELQPLSPDPDCFFVGVESQAWRWEYARRQILFGRAMDAYTASVLEEAAGDMT